MLTQKLHDFTVSRVYSKYEKFTAKGTLEI